MIADFGSELESQPFANRAHITRRNSAIINRLTELTPKSAISLARLPLRNLTHSAQFLAFQGF